MSQTKYITEHDSLFSPILLHLDLKLIISQKCDEAESYNLGCW